MGLGVGLGAVRHVRVGDTGIRHWALGTGHWALGIGHRASAASEVIRFGRIFMCRFLGGHSAIGHDIGLGITHRGALMQGIAALHVLVPCTPLKSSK